MTETLEQIKKTIAEAHEQGIYNWNTATISALITTIESQKEEIEKSVAEIKYQVERNDKQHEAYLRLESLFETLPQATGTTEILSPNGTEAESGLLRRG